MSLSPRTLDPYVQPPASGLAVYRVGLGTMQFGWSTDEPTAFDIMDAYAEVGGNFLDTADCYTAWSAAMGGPPNPGGVSEEIIGRWLQKRGNRDRMIIATKVRAPMGEGFVHTRATAQPREGLSRRWITQACEDSLRRLGVDHIDLYQAHWIDPLTPIEETLAAFTDLVRRGLVRYVGVSNFSAWRLMQALWAGSDGRYEPIISVQPKYNLLPDVRANFERELGPVCSAYGLGVFPYSPLAGGLLTGKYTDPNDLPDSLRAEENAEDMHGQNLAVMQAVVTAATESGMTPAQVALSWLRSRPVVTAPIIGASSVAQLKSTLDGLDRELSPEAIADLTRVSDWPRSRTDLEE